MKKISWIATIKANDEATAEIIKIGIQKFNDEEGTRYDVVSSTGDDVAMGGKMTEEEAIHAIAMAWGECTTFELIDL